MDELKQLLNLEPPKIDLRMFESGMSLTGEKPQKKKKLSVKQRNFRKLLQERHVNTQRDLNPKSLLDHQIESINKSMKKEKLEAMSKGQKKRLSSKVHKFASKKSLVEKLQKMQQEKEEAIK